MQNHKSKYKSDLKKRCYTFSLDLIDLTDSFPNQRNYRIIGDQLVRSGTSVGASLIEANASSSKRDFKRYHEIALKSANETKYWLGLLRDSGKSDKDKINSLLTEITEIANMIAAGILKLKGMK
jgi:four helix bundle protein